LADCRRAEVESLSRRLYRCLAIWPLSRGFEFSKPHSVRSDECRGVLADPGAGSPRIQISRLIAVVNDHEALEAASMGGYLISSFDRGLDERTAAGNPHRMSADVRRASCGGGLGCGPAARAFSCD